MQILAILALIMVVFESRSEASSIKAPIEGNIKATEIIKLLEMGPLTWEADGDMVVVSYFDYEPGVDATVAYPEYGFEISETATSTTAILTLAGFRSMVQCGRKQWDFEMYPLDHSTVKTLVVDMGEACNPSGPKTVSTPEGKLETSQPIPEPATLGLVGLGFIVISRRFRKR